MGSLNSPASGLVYVDAQSFIYTVERSPQYLPVLQSLWARVTASTVNVATSELTLLECLVMPYRRGDAGLLTDYENFLHGPGVGLIPISPPSLREAARLRAAVPRLRTPDAIHAATALSASATLFVTNDFDFRNVPGLTVEVLQDVLARP